MSSPIALETGLATPADYDSLESLYLDVIAAKAGSRNDPLWTWGVHPTERLLRDGIADETLLCGWAHPQDLQEREGGQISPDVAFSDPSRKLVSALLLDRNHTGGYDEVAWRVAAKPEEVAYIHLLAVHPRFEGQGIARAMVEAALRTASKCGMRAVRLDVIFTNLAVLGFYEHLGFVNCGAAVLDYPDDPKVADFVMFEYAL